jgi:hypothetical protein
LPASLVLGRGQPQSDDGADPASQYDEGHGGAGLTLRQGDAATRAGRKSVRCAGREVQVSRRSLAALPVVAGGDY